MRTGFSLSFADGVVPLRTDRALHFFRAQFLQTSKLHFRSLIFFYYFSVYQQLVVASNPKLVKQIFVQFSQAVSGLMITSRIHNDFKFKEVRQLGEFLEKKKKASFGIHKQIQKVGS